MGRRQKEERAGARWHLVARGVDRMTIFLDDLDYEVYVRLLGGVVSECGWIVYAFCLMPNHVHLFIETPQPNLAKGMHLLQFKYAKHFNERYTRGGPLYEGRYRWREVAGDDYFINVAFYVIGNAAKAGLCKRPDDWEWGSLGLLRRGTKLPWIAHDALVEKLRDLTGRTCRFDDWIG